MRIFVLIISFALSFTSFAQNDSTATSGEIIDGEIVIEKEKKITLSRANKIFSKAELKSFNTEPLKLEFEVMEPTFDWPLYRSDIPFQKVANEYPISIYQNFVKFGFGNYSSPLLEAGVYKDIGKLLLGADLFYESFSGGPVNDDYSSSSMFEFDLSARYNSDNISIVPYFNIENRQFNFYGNTGRLNSGFSNEIPVEGLYDQVFIGTRLNGNNRKIQYKLDGWAGKSSHEGGTSLSEEPFFHILGNLSIAIDTAFSAGLDIEGHSSNVETGLTYRKSIFSISPWVQRSKNDFSIKAGFRVASNRSLDLEESGFYPFIESEFKFSPDWSVYALIDGGFDWSGLDDIVSSNQFIDDSIVIHNRETHFSLKGGLKGQPNENLSMNAGLSFASVTNLPLFIPSSSDSSRFSILYDNDKIDIVTLSLGLNYSPNSYSSFGANLEFNGYSLNSVIEPWHLPTFELSIFSIYNISQKLIFSANLISLSGIKAPINLGTDLVKLPGIVDLKIGLNYLLNNRISTFVSANNLMNNEYERYIGYPVRGITFKIGGKYRF